MDPMAFLTLHICYRHRNEPDGIPMDQIADELAALLNECNGDVFAAIAAIREEQGLPSTTMH